MAEKTNTNDSPAATQIPVASEPEAPAAPINVWLVDDDDSYRTLLAGVLGKERGIDCPRHFSSPDAALSALASKTGPDVLLLDIRMRDRNGLDAIRPIKSLARSTRVLMLTTFYDRESHTRAMEEGASGLLLKTYGIGRLLENIRKLDPPGVGRPRRRRSRSHVQGPAEVPTACAVRPGQSKWWGRLPLLRGMLR